MNDAEERFAARLADDLDRVLGPGLAIDEVELSVEPQMARVTATIRVGTRTEAIEASAPDVLGLYGPMVARAAGLRLGAAFRKVVEPRHA